MNTAEQTPLFGAPSHSPAIDAGVEIKFFAPGVPATKGSARAFVIPGKDGNRPRASITNDAGDDAKAWHAVVAQYCHDAMKGAPPIEGPVEVTIVFTLPRLKSHYSAKGLKPNAPMWSKTRPDVDKLTRCLLDALTSRAYGDDTQVAKLHAEKRYDERPGAWVSIRRLL